MPPLFAVDVSDQFLEVRVFRFHRVDNSPVCLRKLPGIKLLRDVLVPPRRTPGRRLSAVGLTNLQARTCGAGKRRGIPHRRAVRNDGGEKCERVERFAEAGCGWVVVWGGHGQECGRRNRDGWRRLAGRPYAEKATARAGPNIDGRAGVRARGRRQRVAGGLNSALPYDGKTATSTAGRLSS